MWKVIEASTSVGLLGELVGVASGDVTHNANAAFGALVIPVTRQNRQAWACLNNRQSMSQEDGCLESVAIDAEQQELDQAIPATDTEPQSAQLE